jgi:hypothetical protein
VRALLAAAVVALSTSPGPVAGTPPAISGTQQQGHQLTVSTGAWTGSGTIAYRYQWYRCDETGSHCSSIHGATRATYVQVAKDVGGTLGATITATDDTGSTAAYAPLAGVVAPSTATLLAPQPAVSGTAAVGQVVTVATPRWSLSAATSYAWQRCNANGRLCAPIGGAATASYTVGADDVGHELLAAVTGTAGTSTQTVLSLPTAPAQPASGPTATARPSVTGTLQQGARLTGRAGTWLGSGAISYLFQWYRCDANGAHCHSIHGATKASYTQVAKDVGGTLGLAVRATDTTGTATAYAPVAGAVAAPGTLAVTRQPTLVGKAAVGQVLALKAGTWSAKPAKTTIEWLRCNMNGRACTGIAGAAGSRYTVTADDRGETIVAAVHATAGSGAAIALTVASLVVL